MEDLNEDNDLIISAKLTQQNKNQHIGEIFNLVQNESEVIKNLKSNYKVVMEVFNDFSRITKEYSNKIEQIALSLKPNDTPEGRIIQALQGTLLFNSDSLNELIKQIDITLKLNDKKVENENEDGMVQGFTGIYSKLFQKADETYSNYIKEIQNYEKYLISKKLKITNNVDFLFPENINIENKPEVKETHSEFKKSKTEIIDNKKNDKVKNDKKELIDNHEIVLNNQKNYFNIIKETNTILEKLFQFFNNDRNFTRKNMHIICEKFMEELIKCVGSQKENYNIFFDVIKQYSNDNYLLKKTEKLFLEKEIYSLRSFDNIMKNQKKFILKEYLKPCSDQKNTNNSIKISFDDILKIYDIFKEKNILFNTNEIQQIEEIKNKKIIENFYINIFNNPENYTDTEKYSIINLFKQDINIYRIYFLQVLNNFRASGNFDVPEKTLDYIGELFKFLANIVLNKNDYDCFRYISIISMTFYKIKNNEKYYLSEYIKDNPTLLKMEFWEKYLSRLIEFDSRNEIYGKKIKITKEDEDDQKKLTCFSDILSVGKAMADFSLDEEFVMKFVNNSIKKYSLSEEQSMQIHMMFEFSNDTNDNKVDEKEENNKKSITNNNDVCNETNENEEKKNNVNLITDKGLNDDICKKDIENKENNENKQNKENTENEENNENKQNKENTENKENKENNENKQINENKQNKENTENTKNKENTENQNNIENKEIENKGKKENEKTENEDTKMNNENSNNINSGLFDDVVVVEKEEIENDHKKENENKEVNDLINKRGDI